MNELLSDPFSGSSYPSHPTPDQPLSCQWTQPPCHQIFSDPETLYNHLCDDHIGRKSTGNLTLRCHWRHCETVCVKRDHITSHLRVHTPLKPHNCEVCGKAFKRPQDLKKHEKIHTEEHHVQHRHSKAITVDPSTHPHPSSRPFAPLPHHAQPLPHPPSSYPYLYQPQPSDMKFSGVSTAQVVQQQQHLNQQTALQQAAQAAAQKVYHSVLTSSQSSNLSSLDPHPIPTSRPSTYPNTYTLPSATYPDLSFSTSVGPGYPSLSAISHIPSATGPPPYLSCLPSTTDAYPVPISNSPHQSEKLTTLGTPSHHASYRNSMTMSKETGAPTQSSPTQRIQYPTTNPPSDLWPKVESDSTYHLMPPQTATSQSLPGHKRDFDEVTSELISRLKRGKYDEGIDSIDRLARFLSPDTNISLPDLDRHNSISDTSSIASSPHSHSYELSSSLTPPSDFEWLAEKSEADKLTDLLATIGQEIESSTAKAIAGEWPDNPSFNFTLPFDTPFAAKPPSSSPPPPLAPAYSPNAGPGSFPTFAPRRNSGTAYGSVSPPSAGFSLPASSYPTLSTFNYHPMVNPVTPTYDNIHVSRSLAPPQLATAPPPTHFMNLQRVAPLQRAVSITSPTAEPFASLEQSSPAESESKHASPHRAPNHHDEHHSSSHRNLDLAPLSLSNKTNPISGTTLPPLRELFGDVATPLTPVGASSPTSPVTSTPFTRTSPSSQSSHYPSLASISASFTRSHDEVQPYVERPGTADSLARRVHGMKLASRKSSLASLTSPSSPPALEDSSSSPFDEHSPSVEDTAAESGLELPSKRSRLSHTSPSALFSLPEHVLPVAERAKLDIAKRRLAIVHSLIVTINQAHRVMAANRARQRFSSDVLEKKPYLEDDTLCSTLRETSV